MNPAPSPVSQREFVALMAALMSLVALSIDAMLPALSQIGESLGTENPNENQLIISTIFLGMSLGLMIYGPLSDSYGRKNSLFLGIAIFLVGTVISLFSADFTIMLVGRVLQGFGAASCRVVSMAMIRDKFEGPEMGKIMSLIMMVFIMVPALAPSVGQSILLFAEWRAIFQFIFVFGLASALWLHFRQPETLVPEKRLQFSASVIGAGIMETLKNPISRNYMLAAGVVFGAFVGYLSSSQQIFQIQYGLGDLFSLYFGGLALVIGLSSFANSTLVMKFSMETLCLVSLIVFSSVSIAFYAYTQVTPDELGLIPLMGYLSVVFFCLGILFGNFNAMAVQPLGHIAGVANSVIGSIQTLLSVAIGGAIGQYYDGTAEPMILGFALCGFTTLAIVVYTQKKNKAS